MTDSGAESLGSCPPGPHPGLGLSHQAARHKIAVRPKRNHNVTRHRHLQQLVEVKNNQKSDTLFTKEADICVKLQCLIDI